MFGHQAWPNSVSAPLMQERHIMVSSPLLWQNRRPMPIMESTLLHILDGDRRIPVWEAWIARHGPSELDARPGLNFSTLDQAINAAVTGAGVVIVDEAMIVLELASGALRKHSQKSMDGPNGYWFVSTTTQPMPGHVVDFKQWLLEHVQLLASSTV
jgi:DNA-binding transcriptional LysR family regulator